MPKATVIEKVKCYFCHKRGYVDPNKPGGPQGWHLEFWNGEEYWICSKCFCEGKIRCPSCGKEAEKVGWFSADEYEIHCYHCQSQF